MSEHDDRLPMQQMLEHAREAVEMTRDRTRADLLENRMFQLALLKLVEVVGEAARRVSPEGQTRYRDIPWRDAITTRNRISHEYDRIDYDIVWDTITDDFPPLVAALERALAGVEAGFKDVNMSAEPTKPPLVQPTLGRPAAGAH